MMQYEDPIFSSVFPILQIEENKRVSIAGTSVLVRLFDLPFLVTAAHVLRKNGNTNPLFLPFSGQNIQIDGPASMTPVGTGNDLDIAVFDLRMQPALLESFSGYKAISLESPSEIPIHERSHYYVFGYPSTRAKYYNPDKLIDITPLDYISDEVNEELYETYKADKQSNILVGYNPKTTINQKKAKTTAPHPYGASGGPLFRILIDKNDHPIIWIFEGIMTEWKNKKVIQSTRKSVIRSFILKMICN